MNLKMWQSSKTSIIPSTAAYGGFQLQGAQACTGEMLTANYSGKQQLICLHIERSLKACL